MGKRHITPPFSASLGLFVPYPKGTLPARRRRTAGVLWARQGKGNQLECILSKKMTPWTIRLVLDVALVDELLDVNHSMDHPMES